MSDSKNHTCKAILGPTNTGKTFHAVERMLSYNSGIIGVPLRLLAREIYDKIVEIKGPHFCALNTGEEKIIGKKAKYWICTTEAMPLDKNFEFLAVDEIQLCADEERGHIFTERLLNARGIFETVFLGSLVMKKLIKQIIPEVQFSTKERFSSLSYVGKKNISKIGPRSAVVDFTVDRVYQIAEQLRFTKGGAAVVLGALSPKTRNAQVELYQSGDVDYLVATDAIGMGLNLNIKNVFFASTRKFDGYKVRELNLLELSQIAGRAGRHLQDGFFGETGQLKEIDERVIYNIENSIFSVQEKIKWRNSCLDFSSPETLIQSLDKSISSSYLEKVKDVTDVSTLKFLYNSSVFDFQKFSVQEVQLLWNICQIPDFRKVSSQDHADIIGKLFSFIRDTGKIPESWFFKEINRLDDNQGDIDTLSKRLSFIRTWCFVANRGDWIENSNEWRNVAREIEDKLSESLHVKLTQRFVDLRRSVLVKRGMSQKDNFQNFVVKNDGEVFFDDHLFGVLQGFNFVLSGDETFEDKKKLMQGFRPFLHRHLKGLIEKFYSVSDTEIDLSADGVFSWNGSKVGTLVKGNNLYAPNIRLISFDELDSDQSKKIEKKLTIFLQKKMETLIQSLLRLRQSNKFEGLVRAFIHKYLENLGVIPKAQVMDEYKAIDNETKIKLKEYGVRFGYKVIYDRLALKPEATNLRLALFRVFHQDMSESFVPPPGLITIPFNKNISKAQYMVAGFFIAGDKIIRVDMLERLFFMLKKYNQENWFEPNPSMLSITGIGLKDFSDLIKSLGFVLKREKFSSDMDKKEIKTDGETEEKGVFLTYEEKGEKFRVFIRKEKRLRNEKEKTKRTTPLNKKSRPRASTKNKSIIKQKSVDPDSPFASLKMLLKN